MRFPGWLRVFGNRKFRGTCPSEIEEQVTLVGAIREQWPETLGRLALHPRNEGARDWRTAARHKAEGLTPGASDIIIPGSPTFVLELKKLDHTKSHLPLVELEYLRAAHECGCFACLALGHEAALQAIEQWWNTRQPAAGRSPRISGE